MGIPLDLAGCRYGKLLVMHPTHLNGLRAWVCRCECDAITIVPTGRLRSGNTTSCGCWKRAVLGVSTTKHGLHNTELYSQWKAMRNRCNNKRRSTYKYWGGRGIKVAPQWDDFAVFQQYVLRYLGPRPSPKHSLDRKNNDGNYEPGNLRWATAAQQLANSRRHAK